MDMCSKKIKICYLITGLNTGGAEMMLYRLLKQLDKTRYSIIVVSIIPLGKVADKIKKLGIDVISMDMTSKLDVSAIFRLVRFLKDYKPTILHSYLFHANLLGRIAGKIAGVPIIISSIRNTIFGGQIRELALRYTDFLSDATTIICETAAKRMISRKVVPKEKLHVIYNGIDPKMYENFSEDDRQKMRMEFNIPDTATLLISVGRLQKQKGYPYLIQSAVELKNRGYNFVWLIAGEGELRFQLEQMVKNYGLEDTIRFLGLREDVPKLMFASDIFVLTSLWEGLPGVVLEAMAVGLPVVATDVGGTPELVEDGTNGFLIPPGNPMKMADAIEKLINMSGEARRKIGSMGKEIVKEKFTVETMARKHEGLYVKLLQKKQYN